ncbi:MAG: 50S ribosomal protein L18 [Ignavibacteriae bacterium]|nr:50S ribosomal protein L18 [Ignavibacteriota bacterium]
MKEKRLKNKIRVSKKISGTSERPRIAVFRSLNQIYAQVIDDVNKTTLVAASSLSKDIQAEIKDTKTKIAKSKLVGKLLAKKAVEKGISSVVFDRSGYRYHGRVQAIAEGAREGGLKF